MAWPDPKMNKHESLLKDTRQKLGRSSTMLRSVNADIQHVAKGNGARHNSWNGKEVSRLSQELKYLMRRGDNCGL